MADWPLITPTIDKIHECSLADKIANITAPDKNRLVTYPGAASFLPAPWLLNAVVEALSRNPVFLISKAIKAAQVYDQEHNFYEEYITSVVYHVDDFILWAWGVGAGQVSKTKYAIDPNDNNLKRFHIKRHQAFLLIPKSNLVSSSQSHALSSSSRQPGSPWPPQHHNFPTGRRTRRAEQATLQRTWAHDQAGWAQEKQDQELPWIDPQDDSFCLRDGQQKGSKWISGFLQAVALAEQELNNQFESWGLGKMSFFPGYTANRYLGTFLWSSNDTPSNHSPFSFSELEPIQASRKTVTSPSSWSSPKVEAWQSKKSKPQTNRKSIPQ